MGVDVARTKSKHRKLEIRLRFDPAGGGSAASIKVEINIDDDLVALSVRLSETPMSPLYKRHISPDHELKALVDEVMH